MSLWLFDSNTTAYRENMSSLTVTWYFELGLGRNIAIFDSVGEILKCDHSSESYWALLSCGALYYAVQGDFDFWVCGWNPKVWPFKWKLLSSTFLWCCLLCFGKWFLLLSVHEILKWYCLFLDILQMLFSWLCFHLRRFWRLQGALKLPSLILFRQILVLMRCQWKSNGKTIWSHTRTETFRKRWVKSPTQRSRDILPNCLTLQTQKLSHGSCECLSPAYNFTFANQLYT